MTFPVNPSISLLTADSIIHAARKQRMVRNAAWYGLTGREMGRFLIRNEEMWRREDVVA